MFRLVSHPTRRVVYGSHSNFLRKGLLLGHSFSTDQASTAEDLNDSDPKAAASSKAPVRSKDAALKPNEVVRELDRHIVGQNEAKKAVAIALRNRWRRRKLPEHHRKEITPRNVLMIGPTGCGKTEIARRMANLDDSPFLKVEATKFTEVGYHGRDVDSIIRDLMDISFQLTKKIHMERVRSVAIERTESKILDILAGPSTPAVVTEDEDDDGESVPESKNVKSLQDIKSNTRAKFSGLFKAGLLDDQEIVVEVPAEYLDKSGNNPGQVFAMGNLDSSNVSPNMTSAVMNLFSGKGGKENKKRKKMKISDAKVLLEEIETDILLENVDLKAEALQRAEESGIVFLDEIDKICSAKDAYRSGADASAEGVQRDLLPLVEGTVINTKYGNVKTDYILFIGSGAFHQCKPADMLPELQGRLPIRVELSALTEENLYQILTEPEANLVVQQKQLVGTEGVELVVEEGALREIARVAALLNKTVENIGARRLHTVMERIMEEISYDCAEMEEGSQVKVSKEMVEERLKDFIKNPDLSRYIL
mmetsp:Transcript_7089/g.10438  ORF Transcript_7089/g.10438 Transcript_7089/m.10438 type:complete len:536 (+) Transcript_7089:119-1726(+)